jgi:release factor glutamine methyltransferase
MGGGPTGRQVIDRFITQAPKHLEKQGEILLMQSSFANVDGTVEKFRAFGLGTEVVATLKLPFFETLSLIRASLTGA